jgi:hypothetical protein
MRTPRLTFIAMFPAAVIACSSPTEPTNRVTPEFIVATGMNVVALGNTTRFAVTAYTRSTNPNALLFAGERADISASASLSSDNPSVAAVSLRNIVGRSAGVANVRATYMGREYAVPVYVVAPNASAQQFAGTWSGVTNFSCADLVGNTRTCADFSGPHMFTTNVSMSLTNVGGILQGSIDIGGGSLPHIIGAVVGGVNDRGELVIGGTPGLFEEGYSEQLRDWRFTFSGTQLTGSGTTEAAFVNIYGPVLHRRTYTAITLR